MTATPNKTRRPTLWAAVSDLPFSHSNLYSAFDAPPSPTQNERPAMKALTKRFAPAAVTSLASALVTWGILHLIIIPLVSLLYTPVYQDFLDEFGWFGIPLLLLWTAIYIFGLSLAVLFPTLLLAPSRWLLLRSPLLGLAGAIVGVLFVVFYAHFGDIDGKEITTFLFVAALCGMLAGAFASFHRRRSSVSGPLPAFP